jgi:hypothetical protein
VTDPKAASRFLATWAADKSAGGSVAAAGGCRAGRPMRQLKTRIRNKNRLRLLQVLAKAHPPL